MLVFISVVPSIFLHFPLLIFSSSVAAKPTSFLSTDKKSWWEKTIPHSTHQLLFITFLTMLRFCLCLFVFFLSFFFLQWHRYLLFACFLALFVLFFYFCPFFCLGSSHSHFAMLLGKTEGLRWASMITIYLLGSAVNW